MSDPNTVKRLGNVNKLYSHCIEAFQELCNVKKNSSNKATNDIIWCNNNVTFNGTTLEFSHWAQSGLLYIKDIIINDKLEISIGSKEPYANNFLPFLIHSKPGRQIRSALAFNFNLHGLQHLQFLCVIPDSVNYDINWFHSAKTSNCIHPMYSCEYMYGFHTIFLSKQCGFQIVFLCMQV